MIEIHCSQVHMLELKITFKSFFPTNRVQSLSRIPGKCKPVTWTSLLEAFEN